jgi:tetratricopeptide (TPR) repeat protein
MISVRDGPPFFNVKQAREWFRAMQLLKKVLNFSAERYLKTAGDLFIYHSDYSGALALVEKALEHDPQDTRALVLYGDILFCLNRDIEALQALNQAIKLSPNLPEAHISRAGVLEVLGKHREALQSCKTALDNIGKSKQYLLPSLFDQKIILLIRLKRFREAQQVLNKATYYLDNEELDYLLSSYKGLLDQCCQKRVRVHEKARKLALCVLPEESKPQVS